MESEIGNLLPKLDFVHCAMAHIRCSNCSFEKYIYKSYIEVEVSDAASLEQGIRKLLLSQPYKRKCEILKCNGSLNQTICPNLAFIFIEPLNTTTKYFEMNGSLDSIPKKLFVNDAHYILRGAIGYVGPDTGLGHFICYNFRHNNLWQEYDDRSLKGQPCSSKKHVRIQLLLYSI